MENLDFESDSFEDIVARDGRYDARSYALLEDVIKYLGKDGGKSIGSGDIMDEFRERALDLYGPMAYTVLTEWGLKTTADIGEMMCNLVESGRVGREENDSYDDFLGGYDFKEAFLGPYAV